MIKVKHLLDRIDHDDGVRLWVEPIGLTRDLRRWCEVDHVLPQLGPPLRAWEELQDHPERYERFAAEYRALLTNGPQGSAVAGLAAASAAHDLTLLHQGDDPYRNSAMVLFEFLISRQERAGA